MTNSKKFDALFCQRGITAERHDDVIKEEALQIIINGIDFSMTMRTPGDDRHLVLGLLHSSGIAYEDIDDYSEEKHVFGACAYLSIADKEITSQRRLMSTSSCGICGERNLDNLFSGLQKIDGVPSFNEEDIALFYKSLAEHQKLFQLTGGSHAAAAFNSAGQLLCAFEDIGRHNAVDKVIGWLLDNNQLHEATALVVSSRISFEIVQKCLRAGIPLLTGISAPTSMAVETARQFNLTLAAFCRKGQATYYSGAPKENKFADQSAQEILI